MKKFLTVVLVVNFGLIGLVAFTLWNSDNFAQHTEAILQRHELLLQLFDRQITEIIELLKERQYELEDNSEVMTSATLEQTQFNPIGLKSRLLIIKRLIKEEIKKLHLQNAGGALIFKPNWSSPT